MKTKAEQIEKLRNWFLANQRPLPWRQKITPYRVWISEIMLQQTRAEVVIDYFSRWLMLFPDLVSLSNAPLEAVIKAWEGLGYYSRARQLHQTAKRLIRDFDGQLPEQESELLKLKGIGPYTAAAITSFAHHQKATPLDGNAIRVLARWNALDQIINSSKAQKTLKELFWSFLPDHKPWELAEAIIELGALVCKPKNPDCPKCPLRENCRAYLTDQIDRYPLRPKKSAVVKLTRLALIAKDNANSKYLARNSLAKGVMSGLWEFPHLELDQADGQMLIDSPERLDWVALLPLHWKTIVDSKVITWSPLVCHTFTRFKVQLRAIYLLGIDLQNSMLSDGLWEYRLMSIKELKEMPFSSGHRRLLNHLEKEASHKL